MSESSTSSESVSPHRARRKVLLSVIALVFILAGVGYGAYWFFVGRYWISTSDAYVHGNQVPLMAQINGTVTTVRVDNTELVHRGEVLVKLDTTDAKLAVEKAEAGLANAVRQVHQLFQRVPELQATVRVRRADLQRAHDDYLRARRLRKSGNVSQQDYQHALTAWHAAQAALSEARHALDVLRAQTGDTDLRHHPRVKLAAVSLRQADVALARTRILAPVTGYVAQSNVELGQQVAPGKPLLTIVPLDRVWVVANFKETVLAKMRVGQPVDIKADLYGSSVHYHGKVLGISPGTGSTFELLPPENATGNWIKVVRRVPVRIGLRKSELKKNPLRLGLSMSVSVDVHDTHGSVLGEAPAGRSITSTDVYQRALQNANARINAIIRANSHGVAAPRSSKAVAAHGN